MANAARRARIKGFTLVEALVALAVLALLLGVAVPGLTGLRSRQQLQAQAEDFWSGLMLARTQAVLHQQHVTVCAAPDGAACDPSASWQAGWLVFVDDNRNGQREAGERTLQQHGALPGTVRVLGNSTVSRLIGYGAEGRSEGLSGGFQAGTVSVCTPGRSEGWRIVINAVGRPRLEKVEQLACP